MVLTVLPSAALHSSEKQEEFDDAVALQRVFAALIIALERERLLV